MTLATQDQGQGERLRPYVVLGVALSVVAVCWHAGYLSGELGSFDWVKERFYFETLRESLRSTGLPPWTMHATDAQIATYPAVAATDSYLANPETLFLSPFLPLAVLPVEWFFKLYLVGNLLVAAAGTAWLTRVLGWRPAAGAVLFLLTFLNPWLVQHLAIGYSPWVTVCWLPLAAALVVRGQPVWAGAVLSIVVWSGGLHVFVWTMMALVVVVAARALTRRPVRGPVVAMVAAVVFAGPRLVAGMLTSSSLTSRVPQSSYSSVGDLWSVMTDTSRDPYSFPEAYRTFGVNLYDGLFFTGWWFWVLAAAAVAVCWWRQSLTVVVGVGVFVTVGWGGVWAGLAKRVPVLGAEVYPWRFLPIGYVFAAVLVASAADRVDRWRHGSVLVAVAVAPIAVTYWQRTQFFVP